MPYVPLLLPLLRGAYVEGWGQGWTIVDLLYYAPCTMTTVGYGDLVPASDSISRIATAFIMPASAFALASMLGRYAALSARRRATRVRQAVMDRGLRASAAGAHAWQGVRDRAYAIGQLGWTQAYAAGADTAGADARP